MAHSRYQSRPLPTPGQSQNQDEQQFKPLQSLAQEMMMDEEATPGLAPDEYLGLGYDEIDVKEVFDQV